MNVAKLSDSDRRPPLFGAVLLLACALGDADGVLAQTPDANLGRSGVRGRLVIAPELSDAERWPISQERLDGSRGAYRVRRPSGATANIAAMEPAPELMVVLEGVRAKKAPERVLVVERQRFVPGQILVPLPSKLVVENKQPGEITIVTEEGVELVTIPAGAKRTVDVDEGVQRLRVKEFGYATATVRTLPKAQVLPVTEKGFIAPTPLPGAEYRLAFYHGAEPLLVRPLKVPADSYIAIDASISKNRVVTVSIKDGDLQVLMPRVPRRTLPRPPPPPPEPAPEVVDR